MVELRGNIWDMASVNDAIVITTNGFVKRDGTCVMGRGIALEAKRRFPGIDLLLGNAVTAHRNTPWHITANIYSMPVKCVYAPCLEDKSNVVSYMKNKFNPGDSVPGWACVASPHIIRESCRHMIDIFEDFQYNIFLPRPGCGAGELNWDQVRPILEEYFITDRWKVCTF